MKAIIVGGLAAAIAVQVSAQQSPYLFDLPKLYPQLYQTWVGSLPKGIGPVPEWLTKFNGVASPIRDVSLEKRAMKFATSCKPHDCSDNIVGVLFSPQQQRIAAAVFLVGEKGVPSTLLIGQMSGAELACIRRLVVDHDSKIC